MHSVLERFKVIENKVNEIINKKQLKTCPKIIVVSKTFPIDDIKPLLTNGHMHYGENKIQEAEEKWLDIKKNYKNLKLHMVGKLQSNKAKQAVNLFDYIHSLDSVKLANKISNFQKELNKDVKIFIQVNLAKEQQKSGIDLNNLEKFYNYCTKELSLKVIGLMCLPPIDSDPLIFFNQLKLNADKLKIHELSMGMSSDYELAVHSGSTFLRIGSSIMGKRKII
jgi:PLP dependent protein